MALSPYISVTLHMFVIYALAPRLWLINIYALEAVQLWQPELLQFEIYAVVKNAVTFHLE